MNERTNQMMIGDIYYMYFSGTGSEQSGWRPGLVFQNNVGNCYSPNIIALPLTSSLKKQNMPTHVLLKADHTGLKRDSMVLCENPERMSKQRVGEYITSLSQEMMGKVAEASMLATSAIAFLSPDVLLSLRRRAIAMNARHVA